MVEIIKNGILPLKIQHVCYDDLNNSFDKENTNMIDRNFEKKNAKTN